jgi:hypothetical protein
LNPTINRTISIIDTPPPTHTHTHTLLPLPFQLIKVYSHPTHPFKSDPSLLLKLKIRENKKNVWNVRKLHRDDPRQYCAITWEKDEHEIFPHVFMNSPLRFDAWCLFIGSRVPCVVIAEPLHTCLWIPLWGLMLDACSRPSRIRGDFLGDGCCVSYENRCETHISAHVRARTHTHTPHVRTHTHICTNTRTHTHAHTHMH